MQKESLNRDRSSGPTHDIQSLKRPALNDESSFEELVTREVGYNLQVRIFRPLKLHIRKAQLRQNVIQSFNMHIFVGYHASSSNIIIMTIIVVMMFVEYTIRRK